MNSFILALRNMFDRAAAEGVTLRVDLRVSGQRFRAYVADGAFEVDAGEATQPDVTIEGDLNDLASVFYDGSDLDRAIDAEALRYEGKRAALEQFLTLFTLPTPAPVPAAS